MALRGWLLWASLSGALVGAETDLDCARLDLARIWVGQLMLSEIEGAEDIHRAAMWEAFGRCAPSANAAQCRESERQRFETHWDRQKKEIEDKYRKMLSNFEQRCRAAVARADGQPPPEGGPRAAS